MGKELEFEKIADIIDEAIDIAKVVQGKTKKLKEFKEFLDTDEETVKSHLVSPGGESVLEHLGVNLAFIIVSLESLDNQVIWVVTLSCHLVCEHLDHVVTGAGSTDLTQESVQLTLRHQDTNIVEGTAQVVLVQDSVLVDVHELEAVLVHLDLLSGESALIVLALTHIELLL